MTINKEDYIKIIYELGGSQLIISNKAIAEALGVSAPSVSEMIGKLVKDGYVDYISYRGVTLTDQGVSMAIQIRKRHLLWEVFLVEKLGYDWNDIHEEAEKLEHITSEKLEKALEKYLDYPKVCPHGSPIIASKTEEKKYLTLENSEREKSYRIVRFLDDGKTLSFSQDIDIRIGDTIKLLANDENKKNVLILCKGKISQVADEYINKIYVEKIDL